VALDLGAEGGHGCAVDGGHGEHRVRIAERDSTDLDRATGELERVAVGRARRAERQRAGIEVRHAHVDRDLSVGLDAGVNRASGAVEDERATACQATAVQQGGDAARAVPALLDLVAGVEDAVEDGAVRALRGREHQCLIEADAGAARGETAQSPWREHRRISRRIEDDEVVADPVHLREIDAHPGAA